MRRKSFEGQQCPIARSLERVGEWWSILILRDAFLGATRFEQFQKSLDIAPNMLTRRLNALVEAGLLERRRYSERPPRDEYLLTERGRDFRPGAVGAARLGQQAFRAGRRQRRRSSTPRPARWPIRCWSTASAARPLTAPAFRTARGTRSRRAHAIAASADGAPATARCTADRR